MAKSILLVEDHPLARVSIAAFLKGEGYDVKDAQDGETALALMEKEHFDLVITDLRLPGRVKGLEILTHENRLNFSKGILITAFGSEDVQKQTRVVGVGYLDKPVLLTRLLEKIEELLRG